MRFRPLITLILVFTALIPFTTSFAVTYTTINNSISPQESASFVITLINTRGYEDSFQVSTRDTGWVITLDPPLTTIPSSSTKSFLLYLKPKQGVDKGPHAVPVKTKSLRSGEFKEDNLLINIKPDSPFGGEYSPSVKLDVGIGPEVDVRNKVAVNMEMNNKNPRDMPNLIILVESDIFRKKYITHLGPLEQEKKELLLEVDHASPAGIHTLTVRLLLKNITIAEVNKDFEVVLYSGTKEEVNKESAFFLVTKTFRVTNDANVQNEIVKELKLAFYRKPFVSFDKEPEKINRMYVWKADLEAQEVLVIVMTQNYRPLALIILILILSLIIYYIFRSPVIIFKSSLITGKDHHIKVRLQIKNRTKRKNHNVKIIDKVPSMATLDKNTHPGSLKPSKVIKSSSKGTSIRWEIEELEPYEERLITYQLDPKLKIIGGIRLPRARIKFQTNKGKERVTYSNISIAKEKE